MVPCMARMREGCAGGGKGPLIQENVSGTLAARNDQTLFEPVAGVYAVRTSQTGANGSGVQQDVAHTIDASCPEAVARGYRVRRLTPRECERLMGLPDDWTRVPYRGRAAEECPDTPRYRAIGNSMAVPVMAWIGERMLLAESAVAVSPELTGGCPRG